MLRENQVDRTETDFDAIVVGAGLAGSIVTQTLATRGFRVLVLEFGGEPAARSPLLNKALSLLYRLGVAPPPDPDRWPERVLLRKDGSGRARFVEAQIGRGLGGSSTLYAAALGRMRREDFETDRRGRHGDMSQPLPNAWPIPFDAFRGAYRRAEALLRVVGARDPLDPEDDSQSGPAPELSPRDAAIHNALQRNGCRPYRLRVGFAYRPGCDECPGRRCAFGCKADGESRALVFARATGRVTIETAARVSAVVGNDTWVGVQIGEGESARTVSAPRLVLAAGALNTPLILDRSEELWRTTPRPAMLGRGLMFHVCDMFAVRTPRRLKPSSVRKTLAVRDHYAGGPAALGEVQSVGHDVSTGLLVSTLRRWAADWVPRPLAGLVELLRPFAWVVAGVIGPSAIFTTITEDLPYAENRVWEVSSSEAPGGTGRIAIDYTQRSALGPETRSRRAEIRRMFAPYPVLFQSTAAAPNLGHPMGTCRMGSDPATSVVDPDGRLWGRPEIYVADASVFASSGGVGPSLTVAAHAFRVADHIADSLHSESTLAMGGTLEAAG